MSKRSKQRSKRKRKKLGMKGQTSSRPFTSSHTSALPEYIAPVGFAAGIGKFIGSLLNRSPKKS